MGGESRLNLRQIEVFRAVMLAGSVTGAARILHISQPAVSRLLRHTEDALGVALFERVKGRLQTTQQAQVLYLEVERAYKSVRHVQDVAQELAGSVRLRIVTSPSLGLAFVPKAIALLCENWREAKLSLDIVSPLELMQQVVTHQADIGVLISPVDHPALVVSVLGQTGLVCIAPQGHPLAQLRVVRPRDLIVYPLISFDRATPQGLLVDDAFRAAGVPRVVSIEVRYGQTACALVQQGAGVAVVDGFSVMHEAFPGIMAREFACDARLPVALINDRTRPLTAVGNALRSILERLAGSTAKGEKSDEPIHNVKLSVQD
jgi:DNA-binding transcriptional LysR family regulator